MQLSSRQLTVIRLLSDYPQSYIFLGEDAGWYFRYGPESAAAPLRLDGRVVHSLQRRKIVNGHARPFTMADGDRVWTLNRAHLAIAHVPH